MLTNTQLKALKPQNKLYRVTDYDSLSIEVPVSGKLRWRFRYRFNGKAIQKSFGTYPEVSLKDARDMRDDARILLAKSIDPFASAKIEEKKEEEKTFREWSDYYLQKVIDDVTETHLTRTLKGFKADVYPYIGDMRMNSIKAKDIIQVVNVMANRGAKESAKKVFSSISRCFQVCMANFPDDIERNPCKDIALRDLLGKRKEVHYPIITDSRELGLLIGAISDYQGHTSTKLALLMIAHTFVRPHNIRHAKWEQINLNTKQWIIPANEMKTRKELIVPLSIQVISILKDAKSISNPDSYIFPSPKSKTSPLSDAALVGALRRLGYTKEQIVAHSFRGIFSTLTHEAAKYDHAVIETQLAHSVGSSVSQAYNRAIYLKERTEMMQWYSDLLEKYQTKK
nr:integrase arm-type DNA-binding domain-containing protein [Sulfurimonas sp. SAG-AH-194-I05]